MSTALEPLALSPREAAAFLSISKRSLSRLIRAGKLKPARLARAHSSMLLRSKLTTSRGRKRPTICRLYSAAAHMRYCGRAAKSVIDDLKGGLANDDRQF